MKNLMKELVDEEMKRTGGNISRVARNLGLNYATLKSQLTVAPGVVRTPRTMPEDIKTLARPEMRQYVIAAKRVGDTWPYRFEAALKAARDKYNAGTHEMCQSTTKEGWVVQYLIPRRRPTGQRTWFIQTVLQ